MLNCPFKARNELLPVHVVSELVVGGEGDHAAPRHAQREEDLDARICPHLQTDRGNYKGASTHKGMYYAKSYGGDGGGDGRWGIKN